MALTETVHAWVLRHYDFKESDRVVVLLTRERGLTRVVARGVRKPRSKWAGRLTPFCENQILLSQGRGMPLISQVDTTRRHQGILTDFERLAAGMAANELLLALLAENDPAPDAYELYNRFLELLPQARHAEAILITYELLLLDCLGYRPELAFCHGCDEALGTRTIKGISTHWGGPCCTRCIPPGNLLRVSGAEWELLVRFQEAGLTLGLEWSAPEPLPRLRQILRLLNTRHAERELRAERMFEWGRSLDGLI